MAASLLDAIRTFLQDHPSVEAAWVFGSVAQGTARPHSDLDVAVLGTEPLDAETKQALIEALARLSGRPVDLVDLQTERGPVTGSILKHGTRLFCNNSSLYAEILKRWLFDQADWMPYRRRILKTRRERWINGS